MKKVAFFEQGEEKVIPVRERLTLEKRRVLVQNSVKESLNRK